MKKRIIIVDDEPMLPGMIKSLLGDDEEFEVSGIAATEEEFFEVIAENSFEVALVDISMGGREGGLDILKTLKRKKIRLSVIVLSSHSEVDYGLKCLQAGAKGYVNKSEICSSLVQALREVSLGHLFVSGDDGTYILSQYKKMPVFL